MLQWVSLANSNSYVSAANLTWTSDVTGLGQTQQKPDLDYFFQTETRTRLLRRNPEKPEPDCETRQNPKGFCKD